MRFWARKRSKIFARNFHKNNVFASKFRLSTENMLFHCLNMVRKWPENFRKKNSVWNGNFLRRKSLNLENVQNFEVCQWMLKIVKMIFARLEDDLMIPFWIWNSFESIFISHTQKYRVYLVYRGIFIKKMLKMNQNWALFELKLGYFWYWVFQYFRYFD